MTKIIFCVLSLPVILLAACNGNSDSKATVDTAKRVTSNTATPMLSSCTGKFPLAFSYDNTKANLWNNYKSLANSTEKVKFDYTTFKNFASIGKANEIYLVYGAYTDDDTKAYHLTHPNSKYDSIFNKPCLLVAYDTPGSTDLTYANDFGSLCPPPNSCYTTFQMSPNFFKTIAPNWKPQNTIQNYYDQYDNSPAGMPPLTQKVKFCMADINAAITSLDTKYGNKTTNIYFAMGAYTAQDATAYESTRGVATDVENRTCLLLAYYNESVENDPKFKDKFIYLDFGVLSDPDKNVSHMKKSVKKN